METSVIPLRLGAVKVFLIKGEQTVLVDVGMPDQGEKIMAGLAANGVAPDRVSLVVITHAHFDHVGSLDLVRDRTRAPVAIHAADAGVLRTGVQPPMVMRGLLGRLLKPFMPRTRMLPIKTFEPEIKIDGKLDLRPFGVEAKVISTPGHTEGSASVIAAGKEAIVGDLMLPKFFFFGAPIMASWAWSREESLKSIRRVMALRPDIVRVSHGGPFRPGKIERVFEKMIKARF